MKLFIKRICLILLLFTSNAINAIEIDVKNINIIRDNYGVPHIYGKTDEEVAYGLAWATAEDDFESMQQNLLAGRWLVSARSRARSKTER